MYWEVVVVIVVAAHSFSPRFGGSAWYHEKTKDAPRGPACVEDFGLWPKDVLTTTTTQRPFEAGSLAARVRKARMTSMLAKGIVLHTDFSGQQSAEIAARMLGVEMRAMGLTPGSSSGSGSSDGSNSAASAQDWLVAWAACDSDEWCRKMILDSEHPSEHVFPEINSRLSKADLQKIISMRPKDTDSKEAKKKAYEQMHEYLNKCRKKFTRDLLRGPCLRHPGASCPVAWLDHGEPASTRPLTMNISGCMCTPWTTYGTQEGLSSKHTESFWVFLETCAGLAFDIVIIENHPGLPKELVQLVLGKLYRIIRVVLGPEDRNAHIEGLAKSL